MAIGSLGMLVTARGAMRAYLGATERLIYLGFILWLTVIGAAHVINARHPTPLTTRRDATRRDVARRDPRTHIRGDNSS